MRRCIFIAACVLALPAAGEDCVTCTNDQICESHAAADKTALSSLLAAKRDGSAAVRMEGIDAFGKACATHSNCRPRKNAGALVEFLDDLDLNVAAKAAQVMGETQDPGIAANYLGVKAKEYIQKVETAKEGDDRGREDTLQRLDSMAEGLSLTGEIGGMILQLYLRSKDLDVMASAATRCRKTRGRMMPSALLEAIERCRTMPASGLRDVVCQDLVVSFEELTKSGIKSPISDAKDPNEMDRWIEDVRKWVRKYGSTWK